MAKYTPHTKLRQPKVLILDIEISLAVAYVYPARRKQYIGATQYKHKQFMLSAAWRWYGQKRIYSASLVDDKKRFKRNFRDDYHVVRELFNAIEEADVIVGHNSDSFDIKHINRFALLHGIGVRPDQVSVDTLKVARKYFNFPFNSMKEIAKELRIQQKEGLSEETWQAAADGDPKAIKRIEKYNRNDVEVQTQMFERLLPYIIQQRKAAIALIGV